MTTFANAPAPQGAIFDNAPATSTTLASPCTSWQTTKTSDAYTPAIAVWGSGRAQRCNVLRERVMAPDQARQALAQRAVVVFVREGDEDAVVGHE